MTQSPLRIPSRIVLPARPEAIRHLRYRWLRSESGGAISVHLPGYRARVTIAFLLIWTVFAVISVIAVAAIRADALGWMVVGITFVACILMSLAVKPLERRTQQIAKHESHIFEVAQGRLIANDPAPCSWALKDIESITCCRGAICTRTMDGFGKYKVWQYYVVPVSAGEPVCCLTRIFSDRGLYAAVAKMGSECGIPIQKVRLKETPFVDYIVLQYYLTPPHVRSVLHNWLPKFDPSMVQRQD